MIEGKFFMECKFVLCRADVPFVMPNVVTSFLDAGEVDPFPFRTLRPSHCGYSEKSGFTDPYGFEIGFPVFSSGVR